ncbi:MAG: TIM barrel protein [Planctomycetaceae bacterium]
MNERFGKAAAYSTTTQVPVKTRRRMLKSLAGCAMAAAVPKSLRAMTQDTRRVTGMGLVLYNCSIRRKQLLEQNRGVDLFEPLTFLKHCHTLGAGGMQAQLRSLTLERVGELRDYAAKHSLYIEAIVSPPDSPDDLDRFDSEIRTAAAAGALAARTVVMPGRRYERFQTLAEFVQFEAKAQRMLELAAPIVERHRLPLAVENHKDQRNNERIALMEHIDSEFVGICVDTGNSFALAEDPLRTIEAFAPWAKSVHIKDQALLPYDDGFLLGDIPLGQGSFDLPAMVRILREAKPDIRFTLELITRDALKVPCLTKAYKATMPDLPAEDVERTMKYVREHQVSAVQQVSSLSPVEQLALEDSNIAASLKYAGEQLSL